MSSVSVQVYSCTVWILTKQLEKKLDENYTRMLRAVLNKSWKQNLQKQQLYGHLPPISHNSRERRGRHAGHCCGIKDELKSNVLLWTEHTSVG